ncbi:hypothetical protein OIU79_019070 [Salix purpurea]|uniref:Uncharacterized protein n=1 Tax=Salix purpurea TaxID=77065 RepID=A0A9Q0P0A9_SALPP|nr:hypothetical protein OIU79_019070 [Salix purpurea]
MLQSRMRISDRLCKQDSKTSFPSPNHIVNTLFMH